MSSGSVSGEGPVNLLAGEPETVFAGVFGASPPSPLPNSCRQAGPSQVTHEVTRRVFLPRPGHSCLKRVWDMPSHSGPGQVCAGDVSAWNPLYRMSEAT